MRPHRAPLAAAAVIAGLAAFAASSARAQDALRLHVDTDLITDAAMLVGEHTQASATLPAFLDLVKELNGASGSSGGSGGVLSGVAIGLQVGTPTAITFKFGAGGNANIVLGVGLGFGYVEFGRFFGLSLHGDYLFTLATLVNNGTIDLSAYLGPGIWLTLFNADRYVFVGNFVIAQGVGGLIGIGGRLPIGLSLRFAAAPIEIYLELDPALFVFPVVGGFIGASLGFRWFF